MKILYLLTSANLRKGKSQTLTFSFIILIAALLMNLGLVTWLNYNINFDKEATTLNAADAILVTQSTNHDLVKQLSNKIRSDARTQKLELRSIIFTPATFTYNNAEQMRNLVILNAKNPSKMNKVSYIKKSKQIILNPVYLPYLFYTGGGYEIGDSFNITITTQPYGKKVFTYTVAGFFEETYLATINTTIPGIILEDREYTKLSNLLSSSSNGTLFLVKLHNVTNGELFSSKYKTEMSNIFSKKIINDSTYYSIIKQARTVTSFMASILVVSFSFVILVIALVVIKFRIGNSIELEMQNIGAQKAIGYTSTQIIASILLQFSFISLLSCLLGIILSYRILPLLSSLFAAQTGIIWNPTFDLFSALLTLCFILFIVTFVSFLVTRTIRQIQPIAALRFGITTHNFKKNPFPLARYRGNLTILLSMKSFLVNTKHNITVGLIICAISFASIFSSVLYYNIVVDDKNFNNLVVGEITDIKLFTYSSKATKEVILDLKKMPQVQKVFSYNSNSVSDTDTGSDLMCYITADFSLINNSNMVYAGRFPKYNNEVAIGGQFSKIAEKKIGDTILLSKNDITVEYLITGLIQDSNYLGRSVCLTDDGYRKFAPNFLSTVIYVYLNNGVNTEDFITEIETKYNEKIATSSNYIKEIRSVMSIYKHAVIILAYVILSVTIVIIALTIYLVIKTMLLHKKQDLGIQKALGFTTHQLIIQTSLSFLPTLALGSLSGTILGYVGVNPLLSLLLSSIGMMKVNFIILPSILVGVFIGITTLGFFVSLCVSARIKRITPYALINE
ncbi:MAG: ABC transporter permease [Velocimicrobium sp.]